MEGEKIVHELLLSGHKVRKIVATGEWFGKSKMKLTKDTELISTDYAGLKKISSQITPANVIAIADIPDNKMNESEIENELSIVLDDIQDPGNLGTIIRTADWFGIKNIFCSSNSVDVYNPKVVQSTMGAVFRVNTWYINIEEFLEKYRSKLKIYGTYLDGESIYNNSLSKTGLIIFGNESKGINKKYDAFISRRIVIPIYSNLKIKPESLNLSVSVAIVIAEFKRKTNSILI